MGWSYKQRGDTWRILDNNKQVAEANTEINAKIIKNKMNDFDDLKESTDFMFRQLSQK